MSRWPRFNIVIIFNKISYIVPEKLLCRLWSDSSFDSVSACPKTVNGYFMNIPQLYPSSASVYLLWRVTVSLCTSIRSFCSSWPEEWQIFTCLHTHITHREKPITYRRCLDFTFEVSQWNTATARLFCAHNTWKFPFRSHSVCGYRMHSESAESSVARPNKCLLK